MARRKDDEEVEAAPRSDAYTGLLLISLLAMIAGAIFLYLDYSEYPQQKPGKYDPPVIRGGAPAAPQPTATTPPAG